MMEIGAVGADAPSLCRMAKLNIETFPALSDAAGKSWDLLALTPGAARTPCRLRSGVLLLPGDSGGLLTPETFQAVDYGFSRRDTLTLSSFTGSSPLLCIQRTVFNLRGEALEPQEIPLLGAFRRLDRGHALFLAGLMLLCSAAGSQLEIAEHGAETGEDILGAL